MATFITRAILAESLVAVDRRTASPPPTPKGGKHPKKAAAAQKSKPDAEKTQLKHEVAALVKHELEADLYRVDTSIARSEFMLQELRPLELELAEMTRLLSEDHKVEHEDSCDNCALMRQTDILLREFEREAGCRRELDESLEELKGSRAALAG
ncbi:uncharacterized protein LTR77_001470 [Saxophila tyrrhenica]|uniref:Uncharacterized protein n=1 Tax=Saxophila tyrrhenica TaxID=1690608 RepID=A0AAV9PKW8_9PEZI|nr:hypothetical protein LTR77_001470 [Saxophila tyrrhenica]